MRHSRLGASHLSLSDDDAIESEAEAQRVPTAVRGGEPEGGREEKGTGRELGGFPHIDHVLCVLGEVAALAGDPRHQTSK